MRAFVIRFAGTFVVAALAMTVALLVSPDFPLSVPWVLCIVVGIAVVGAASAYVADEVRGDPNTFGRDERTVRQLLGLDREQNRLRRQERRFGNSVVAGFISLGIAFFLLGIEWSLDTNSPGNYLLAVVLAWNGAVPIWNGVQRWRDGGEFNLPGSAGPVRREPPRETRGD